MDFEEYKKLRHIFLQQYKDIGEDTLGVIQLTEFKIKKFKLFIFVFTNDYRRCKKQNVVSSIRPHKFRVGRGSYANAIGVIENDYSFLDRYPHLFDQIVDFYQRKILNNGL